MIRGWENQFQCGHPKTEENTLLYENGRGKKRERCKECHHKNRRPKTLEKAYKLLGVTSAEVFAAPKVTTFLGRIGGVDRAIEVLYASPAPEARSFVKQHSREDLSKSAREVLPFEAYCVAAKVCPSRMIEIVVGAIAKHQVLEGAVISALSHPQVVRTNAYQAMFPEGVEDRMAHLKMMGALPIPKSAQTSITVNANAQAVSASKSESVAALPSAEDTIRRIVEARQRAALSASPERALPAASETVPVFMPQLREPVMVDAEYDADE
jgi:hypothetical protein